MAQTPQQSIKRVVEIGQRAAAMGNALKQISDELLALSNSFSTMLFELESVYIKHEGEPEVQPEPEQNGHLHG